MSSSDVDAYIADQPKEVASKLRQIRRTIHGAVPTADETINYGIPTFQLRGKNMVHYGPGKHHVGLYATPDGHAEFESELETYKRGKGSVQFPLNKPLPLDLIRRIVVFRANQISKGVR